MSAVASVVYDFFGHVLELRCPSPAIIDALTQRESCWKPAVNAGPSADPDVVIDVILNPPPCPLTEVQHFSNEHFFFHGSSSRLLSGYLYARPWQIHVQSFVEDDETTLDNMILPTLGNILLRLGLVNVHCAAVAHEGRGLLLIGPSQSGKSTTSLLMARAGFDFLSDNDVYLRSKDKGVAALSNNKELFLLDSTAQRFAELDFAGDLPVRNRGGTAKRVLNMDRALPNQSISETDARVVVFPSVGDGLDTEVEVIEPYDCLEYLMQLVPARGLPAMIKDQWALKTLFDLLSTLSMTASAYRVRLGSDPTQVVAKLGALIEGD